MLEKDRSSVMSAIFKRNGGEGKFTKLVTTDNKSLYANVLTQLKDDEKGIIIYFKNENDWSLLTNKRLIVKPGPDDIQYDIENVEGMNLLANKQFSVKPFPDDRQYEISITDLRKVQPSYLLERFEGLPVTTFSRLILTDKDGKNYILRSESGGPIQGLYQALIYMLRAPR